MKQWFIKLTTRKNGYSEYIPVIGDNYKAALINLDAELQKNGDSLKNYRTKNLKTYRCEFRNHEMLNAYKNMGCYDFIEIFYYVEKMVFKDQILFIDKYDKQRVIDTKDIISMGKRIDAFY